MGLGLRGWGWGLRAEAGGLGLRVGVGWGGGLGGGGCGWTAGPWDEEDVAGGPEVRSAFTKTATQTLCCRHMR